MGAHAVEAVTSSNPPVDFLWLELTNQCNLQCTHCYSESGPHADKSTLSASQYVQFMREAHALGCRRVQFIGGEPTLNRELRTLISEASGLGFEFIEVFTNLTRLPEDLLECLVRYRVRVATSVYSSTRAGHDAITQVNGSFENTVKNLRRLVHAGVPVRVGIIEMDANAGQTDATTSFLRELGVKNVGVDRLRRIGRGTGPTEVSEMSELCGGCAGSTLCISPTGQVSPCIMSKKWSVGSATEASLGGLVRGDLLRDVRRRIRDAVVEANARAHGSCNPTAPCSPMQTCYPQSCDPNRICYPQHCDPNR